MFDIGTHVGRRLVNEEKGEELTNTQVGYYGSVPKNLLAVEYEEIEEHLKRSDELEKLLKSLKNGYKKYLKMRPSASKAGTLKMKEVVRHIKDHPLLTKDEDNREQDQLLEEIKNFKLKKGKKKAFTNPFTDTMQKILEHSNTHRIGSSKDQEEMEESKLVQSESDEQVIEKPLEEIPKRKKRGKKRAQPETYKDAENYISFEPTTSKERLKKVLGRVMVVVGRRGAA
eukprot:TRINITY_DN9354_c0_g4_i2.p2 TRINITY_DN9354_c0_g4~~TRINITY_DN9354_c0_g4_i2.p2  ORF type:complete len:228 (-),score=86.81 TRINITY_DN9354_c0_g4_i2:528-1211(-)